MENVTARTLIDVIRDTRKYGVNEMLKRQTPEQSDAILEYMAERSSEAKSCVLARMPEEDFVMLLGFLESALLSALVVDGKPNLYILTSGGGEVEMELKSYTHELVLTMLGIAMSEELL